MFSLRMGFDGNYSHEDNERDCMHYLCKWDNHYITKHLDDSLFHEERGSDEIQLC